MVAEDEEMVVFKLWSCSSTLMSLEQGLEGTLAYLRWKAMASMEAEVLSFPVSSTNGKEESRKETAAEMLSTCHGSLYVMKKLKIKWHR